MADATTKIFEPAGFQGNSCLPYEEKAKMYKNFEPAGFQGNSCLPYEAKAKIDKMGVWCLISVFPLVSTQLGIMTLREMDMDTVLRYERNRSTFYSATNQASFLICHLSGTSLNFV